MNAKLSIPKLKRWPLAAISVAGSLVISIAALTGTASAVLPCNINWICFYVHQNFGGSSWAVYNPTPGACYNVPPAYNDQFSSGANRSSRTIQLHENYNCSGGGMYIEPDKAYNFSWLFNDEMTSVKIY